MAVSFAQAVTGHTGAGLTLTVGSASRTATLPSGASGQTLTFAYQVEPGDADSDGIAIAANALPALIPIPFSDPVPPWPARLCPRPWPAPSPPTG